MPSSAHRPKSRYPDSPTTALPGPGSNKPIGRESGYGPPIRDASTLPPRALAELRGSTGPGRDQRMATPFLSDGPPNSRRV